MWEGSPSIFTLQIWYAATSTCPWRQTKRQTSAKQEPSVKHLLMPKQLYMWRAFLSLHGPCSQHTVPKASDLTLPQRKDFLLFLSFHCLWDILNYVRTQTKTNTFKTQEAVKFNFTIKLMTEILCNKWASEPLHFWFTLINLDRSLSFLQS